MISTEFPRTKLIKQIEENMKVLNYTSLEFYHEIVKEQISILRDYISLNKNERNFNVKH